MRHVAPNLGVCMCGEIAVMAGYVVEGIVMIGWCMAALYVGGRLW